MIGVPHPHLHVIRCYIRRPPMSGGMEKHIAALSQEQRRQGLRVTDVYNSGSANGEAVQVLRRLELHRVRPAVVRDLIFFGLAAWQLRGLRGGESMVIHAHGHWSASLMARLLGRWLGAKLVVLSVHCNVPPRLFRWRVALGRKTLMFATGMEEVRFLQKASRRTAYHVPSAPDERFFAPATRAAPDCDVICVGNIRPAKNYPLVLDLAARMPDRRFAIYGDGPDLGELTRRAAELGLTNIEWRGQADIDTIRSALDRAGVLVNCSIEEGSPTSALEAMSCGVPVVLTPANDYSSLLNGNSGGIALQSWDLNELEAEVRSILENSDRRAALSEGARRIALEHRWPKKAAFITDQMLRAMDEERC